MRSTSVDAMGMPGRPAEQLGVHQPLELLWGERLCRAHCQQHHHSGRFRDHRSGATTACATDGPASVRADAAARPAGHRGRGGQPARCGRREHQVWPWQERPRAWRGGRIGCLQRRLLSCRAVVYWPRCVWRPLRLATTACKCIRFTFICVLLAKSTTARGCLWHCCVRAQKANSAPRAPRAAT